jgi:hypothetical protein
LGASDEAVERFAVQVGNDTDEFRKPCYQQMLCLISENCQLSPGVVRILQNIFGEVRWQPLNSNNKIYF